MKMSNDLICHKSNDKGKSIRAFGSDLFKDEVKFFFETLRGHEGLIELFNGESLEVIHE